MSFKCGIVGLPNVGKSSLFNLLLKKQSAESANYPFCTIEPNVGKVSVKDNRLKKLAKIANSDKIIFTQLEVVDIAGIVKGASKGEGLGNKFLANIREVDAILHVIRCFEDSEIVHVDGTVNPIRDISTIELELILSDIESLEKQLHNIKKLSKNGNQEAKEVLPLLEKTMSHLLNNELLSNTSLNLQELKNYNLLTTKPMIYICNVGEEDFLMGNQYTEDIKSKFSSDKVNIISVKLEEELISIESEEERELFMKDIGMLNSGFDCIINAGYIVLNLETFFTSGPKEARAWAMPKNCLAPQAAGVIHTDFEKGFIKAEVIAYQDYINNNGESACKDKGLMRMEGKDYVMQDGDVVHFKFNV